MKLSRDQTWSIQDLVINLLIFTENLNTKLKTLSTQLVQSTQMRHQRSVKCMTFRRTSGLRFVILLSQDITTQSLFMIADTFTLLVVETRWMRLLLNPLSVLMDTLTYSSRNGNLFQLSTRTMPGLLEIHLDPLLLMIQKFSFLEEIMDGLAIASTSIPRQMWFWEWISAVWKSQRSFLGLNQ